MKHLIVRDGSLKIKTKDCNGKVRTKEAKADTWMDCNSKLSALTANAAIATLFVYCIAEGEMKCATGDKFMLSQKKTVNLDTAFSFLVEYKISCHTVIFLDRKCFI